jgi:hypothetical protein
LTGDGARSRKPSRYFAELTEDSARTSAPTQVLGRRVVRATPSAGGYTQGWRGIVHLDDGSSAFVKVGGDSVRREAKVQTWLAAHGGSQLAPALLDFADDDPATLVLQDLSAAQWPPPYPVDTTPLFETLAGLAKFDAPSDLERLEEWDQPGLRWAQIAGNPDAFLNLGVCSWAWLEANAVWLMDAESRADLRGKSVVHNDLWAGNVCFADGQAKLVDWATAARGNPDLDMAFAILSVIAEGGRLPDRHLLNDEGAWAARMAGHNAVEATLPLPAWAAADSTLRTDQLRDMRVALAWAARVLGMAPLDAPAD